MQTKNKTTHSWLGISSFIISIIFIAETFITFLIAGVLEVSTQGGLNEQSATAVIIGMVIIFFNIIGVIGLGLGIAALFEKNKKKIFSVLGVILNTIFILINILTITSGLNTQ